MAAVSQTPTSQKPKLSAWLILVVGALFAALGAIGSWGALDLTLRGVPATAKVIEHSVASSRSATIDALVEVTVPGEQPFRTDVEDTFGMGKWEDGATVNLVCAPRAGSHSYCGLDSVLDRWLLPAVLFAVGLGAIWLWWRGREAERRA